MNRRRAETRGFTLVELLITIVVVGILVSIAYPSYANYLRKARRADAQRVLMDIALRQQQLLLDTRAYATDLAGTGASVPTSVTTYYTITVTGSNPTGAARTFTATATPQGRQVGDSCATLTVNEAGARTPTNCW